MALFPIFFKTRLLPLKWLSIIRTFYNFPAAHNKLLLIIFVDKRRIFILLVFLLGKSFTSWPTNSTSKIFAHFLS